MTVHLTPQERRTVEAYAEALAAVPADYAQHKALKAIWIEAYVAGKLSVPTMADLATAVEVTEQADQIISLEPVYEGPEDVFMEMAAQQAVSRLDMGRDITQDIEVRRVEDEDSVPLDPRPWRCVQCGDRFTYAQIDRTQHKTEFSPRPEFEQAQVLYPTKPLDPRPWHAIAPEGKVIKGRTRFETLKLAYSNGDTRFEPRPEYEQDPSKYPLSQRPTLDPEPYVFQGRRFAAPGEPNSRVGWGDRSFKPRPQYEQSPEAYA
jgi:hypothetical protein